MAIYGRSGWLAAFLLAAMLAPTHADECRSANTQADLNQCAGKSFEKANAALNATYKTVMDRLSGQDEGKRLLVAAQKAWLGFRDGECDFETSSSIGGSAHPMAVMQCKADVTTARTEALRRLLSCPEGDLACPIPPR